MLAHDRDNADGILEVVLTICSLRKKLEQNEAVSVHLRTQLDILIVELQKAGLNFVPVARAHAHFDVKQVRTWPQLRDAIASAFRSVHESR